jgi:hypothetical protein
MGQYIRKRMVGNDLQLVQLPSCWQRAKQAEYAGFPIFSSDGARHADRPWR